MTRESFQPCERNNYSDPFHGLLGILDTQERFRTRSVRSVRSKASGTAADGRGLTDDPRGGREGREGREAVCKAPG